ncbi:MAG: hypothetical protein BWY42_01142 [Candidatus Omnitrophica bacterium ADurb.Bin277]|nr:MAG: hypothetical protein BWY42_01142 [Candidatus Omnitrophica bacterium ADurb.Bin277]
MEINSQLIKPYIEKMEAEWLQLYSEVCGHPSHEASEMKPSIEQRMRQLEKFRTSAMYFGHDESGLKQFPNLREALRLLKLDLRATRRKWRRYLVSKIRTQKRQERASYAPTITD